MELTREEIESYKKNKDLFGPHEVHTLVDQLLAEMDKPGVWDNAPEWATTATVVWYGKGGQARQDYTRELPKSRERQIAEEYTEKLLTANGYIKHDSISIIEQALLKYKAELEAGR